MSDKPALITFEEGKSYVQTLLHDQFKPPGVYYFKCEKVENKYASGILLYIENPLWIDNSLSEEPFSISNNVTYYEDGYCEEVSQEEIKEKINHYLIKILNRLL